MADAGFEILEHTADVGIGAWGDTVESAFEQAGWGLVDILDIRSEEPGEPRAIRASGSDLGGLVVGFLNELILLHESEQVAFGSLQVRSVRALNGGYALEAEAGVTPVTEEVEASVKAATYHQLRVSAQPGERVELQVYLDV